MSGKTGEWKHLEDMLENHRIVKGLTLPWVLGVYSISLITCLSLNESATSFFITRKNKDLF